MPSECFGCTFLVPTGCECGVLPDVRAIQCGELWQRSIRSCIHVPLPIGNYGIHEYMYLSRYRAELQLKMKFITLTVHGGTFSHRPIDSAMPFCRLWFVFSFMLFVF